MAQLKYLIYSMLALTGCASSSPWKVSYLQGSQKEFDSARLLYPASDKVNGLSVEMIYAQASIRTYLSVYSQAIPPLGENNNEALITLKIEGQSFQAIAPRHAGNQRVLLPSSLENLLVQNLLNGKIVIIELQGYSTTLYPSQFASEFQKLSKAPFKLPFQLPFKLGKIQ